MNPRLQITVITVVFNDARGLERTIQSVIGQSYGNVEYIIIDGGSSDNTIQVIKKYEEFIDLWVSEEDSGIYHAMNKGVLMADSDYMCFMNAGDAFISENTIAQVVLNLEEKIPAILYGNAVVCYKNGFRRIVNSKKINHLWKGMCFSHQAMFVQSDIMKNNLYNLDNRLSADYEFICGLYDKKNSFESFNGVIVSVTAGGVSDTMRVESVIGHWRIAHRFWPGFKVNSYYIIKLMDTVVRYVLHRMLPNVVVSLLTKLKYIGQLQSAF